MHVKPNEWYSYLTEKRTSTVTLLVNLIIAITLVDVIKNLHTFIFFLVYIYNFSKFLELSLGFSSSIWLNYAID